MAERDVERSHEGGVGELAHRAVEDAAERDGAVEDRDGEVHLGRGLERELERGEVCVAPRADVLEVDDDAADAFEHLRRGAARLAVEGVDGYVPERMARGGGLLAWPGEAEPTVLRREQGGQARAEGVHEYAVGGRCLVREERERLVVGDGQMLD